MSCLQRVKVRPHAVINTYVLCDLRRCTACKHTVLTPRVFLGDTMYWNDLITMCLNVVLVVLLFVGFLCYMPQRNRSVHSVP